jgi:beta-lactamase regulating signal transducer with metallopeptidase domain
MQHLFQSAFLQALGYAITNSLWQTALLWLVYMSVTGLVAMNAAAKYRLAVAAQVTGFVWFLVTYQFYYSNYNDALQHAGFLPAPRGVQAIISPDSSLLSGMINWMARSEQLLPYLSMAYLLLMALLCTRWLLGYRKTQMIRNSGLQKMPAEWRLFVNKIASQLAITKTIQVFLSNAVTTPLTIGFLKPVILVPLASINHLTTDQLEAVLLHELAHIKRYDYLVNIVLSVVETALFFNPFTQLLRKTICKERENSCDDWVLQFQYKATVYAEALLRIAYLQSTPAFAMAAAGKKNELLQRVKRIIGQKESRFGYRRQLLAFLLVTTILISIAWFNPLSAPSQNKTVFATESKMLLKNTQYGAAEAIEVKPDNPLFTPVFFSPKPVQAEMKKSMVLAHKEITRMQADRAPFRKRPDTDTVLLPPKMTLRLPGQIKSSLPKMDIDIQPAQIDLPRVVTMNADFDFNKDEMRNSMVEAMQAMEELKKAGLDKWVLDALKMSASMMNDKRQPEKRKMRMASFDDNNTVGEKINADELSGLSANGLSPLNGLQEMKRIKLTLDAINRVKNMLRFEQEKRIKTIRIVFHEPEMDEQKITILLQ